MPDVRGYGAEQHAAANPHFTPGSWRNGGGGGGLDASAAGGALRPPGNHVPNVTYSSAAPGSGKSSTATLQMPGEVPILRRLSDYGGSVDSMGDTSEDASDRRGSATGSSTKDGKEGGGRGGVGSRLSDLVEKGKGGKKPKRKKDKQGRVIDGSVTEVATNLLLPTPSGFVWRRMIHDQEDFSQTRTPRLAPTPAPATPTVPQSTVSALLNESGPKRNDFVPSIVGTHAVSAAGSGVAVFAGGDVERRGDVAAPQRGAVSVRGGGPRLGQQLQDVPQRDQPQLPAQAGVRHVRRLRRRHAPRAPEGVVRLQEGLRGLEKQSLGARPQDEHTAEQRVRGRAADRAEADDAVGAAARRGRGAAAQPERGAAAAAGGAPAVAERVHVRQPDAAAAG